MKKILLKEEIKKYNRDSTSFVFNEADLIKEEESFKISSPELQNLLNSFAGSNINTIIFLNQPSSFLKKQETCPDFRWIMVKKENISKKVRDGILYLSNNDYNLISGWTNLDFLTDNETWKKIKEAEIEKDKENEILSFFREINTEIEVNGICRGDLEGFYVVNLPDNCSCEIVPNNSCFLYINHMKNCCSDRNEIVSFKNDIINVIPEVKKQLNNFKQVVIKKVQVEMKKKAVSKEDEERLLPNWKNRLTFLRSTKELEEKCNLFLKKIHDFSEASNKEEQEKVYEEAQTQFEELEKEQAESRNKEQQRQQEKLNEERQNNKNNPPSTPNQEEFNNQNKDNSSPDKEQKNLNNPLPTPTEIQNNYNSDKTKSEIENSSQLTNPEQKNQANELLKVIITAELLIKETKFNPEILTKLLEIKKQDNSLYQILNKEGRIDKVISQLESIQKSNKNNNNSASNPKNHNKKQPISLTAKLFIGGGIVLVILTPISILWLVRSRRKKAKIKGK